MTATAPARLPAEPPATVAGIAQPRVATQPLIDPEVLDALRSMLGGEVDRLIDVVLEDTPRLITTLALGAAGATDHHAPRRDRKGQTGYVLKEFGGCHEQK